MIQVFEGTSADIVWQQAMKAIDQISELQSSRAGDTHEILHAVLSFQDPRQRWIISRRPPINVAFAFAEVVWILNGRNDSAFLNYWNRKLPEYAGYGETYYGAYGHRLRRHFKVDQLDLAYDTLKNAPDSRQAVLQIWDVAFDLPTEAGRRRSQDIPCNVMSFLKVRDGRLEWMQILRSNDIMLGVPYNFVQFTTLQEIIAGWLEIDVGTYTHLSDSLHRYIVSDAAIAQDSQSQANTDDLRLPRAESQVVFATLATYIERLISPGLTEEELLKFPSNSGFNPAYRNILTIMCLEAARRRKWISYCEPLLEECTNPALVALWRQWFSRYQSEPQ